MKSESYQTTRYQLLIQLNDHIETIKLIDNYSKVVFADSPYRYSAYVQFDSKYYHLNHLYAPRISEHISDRGGRTVTISGFLGGNGAPAPIALEHRFYLPEDDEYFEERIVLKNPGEQSLRLAAYRFAFRKSLATPQSSDIEGYRVVALPFRLQPDGRKHDYTYEDMVHGDYQKSRPTNPRLCPGKDDPLHPRARSEAWAWTDGEEGLLISKYNPNMIEYSMLETETSDTGVYLNFGGASHCYHGEPAQARTLAAGEEIAFGRTRYHLYEGLWRRASYMFRDHISSLGHGFPDEYKPKLYWNISAPALDAEILERECNLAKEIGCEAISLGSLWEKDNGSGIWSSDDLPSAAEVIADIKARHGLGVGLDITGRDYSGKFSGLHRRDADGAVGYSYPYSDKQYYEPCYCSKRYRQETISKAKAIASASPEFLRFVDFEWTGQCFDAKHDHKIGTGPGDHVEAVMEIVSAVSQGAPNVTVQAQDPIEQTGVRYTPVYYQSEPGVSFDEMGAFGLDQEPLESILSGKAFSLYYYNLAYDLPLGACIDMDKDNENALAFWWFASTVRHLGIKSSKSDPVRMALYGAQIKKYLDVQEALTQGAFYALDEVTHIHALSEEGICIVNAFNLTDKSSRREAHIRLSDLGFLGEVCVECAGHRVEGGKIVIELDIAPFTHQMIRLTFGR